MPGSQALNQLCLVTSHAHAVSWAGVVTKARSSRPDPCHTLIALVFAVLGPKCGRIVAGALQKRWPVWAHVAIAGGAHFRFVACG